MSGSDEGYLVPPVFTEDLTDWQLAIFRDLLRDCGVGPYQIWPPLPRRVRLRLAVNRRVDSAACWLVEHGHCQAALWVWRVCGLWAARNPPPGQEIAPPE